MTATSRRAPGVRDAATPGRGAGLWAPRIGLATAPAASGRGPVRRAPSTTLATARAPLGRGGARWVLGIALAAALVAAGCGGVRRAPAFAWLRPAPPPAGWRLARLPSGAAALAYPPGWRPIRTDPGTVSLALLAPGDRIRGYLNATPQSGPETLANWARFRPDHNRDEGDRSVVTDAGAAHLRFRAGTGSCVMDHYATASARYREIACLVRGAHATTVVVAAAPPRDWPAVAPLLRRAVASFAT